MTRQGLKRLECVAGCGALAYMTLSQLERHGCPVCPCGAGMVPEDLEVAAAVLPRDELERTPSWAYFAQRVEQAMHGQASHRRPKNELRAPETVALDGTRDRLGIRDEMKAAARQRRLAGLVQFQQAAQAAAEIPF